MNEIGSRWDQLVGQLLEASDEDVDPGSVQRETRLREDLDLGSLQAVTLVMDLEDEFGIVVEDEELESLVTVGDIADLIESKLPGGSEGSSE